MTREEAIANIKMISIAFVESVTKEQRKLINETFDMAIKALEQEPCEDSISRQAVFERIKREEKILYTPTGMNYLIRAIGELPSVNPQEPKDSVRACGIMGNIERANALRHDSLL